MKLYAVVIAVIMTFTPDPPVQPTGFGATPGATQITLNWDDVAQADGYHVYRAPVSGGTFEQINAQLLVASGPYTDSSLNAGTRYFYVVKAQNSEGLSPSSSEVSAIPTGTDTTPPAPPVILSDPRKTRDTTPSTHGTAEPGTTVTVYAGGNSLGSTAVAMTGSWTLANPTALGADGPYTITARAVDGAANQSEPSTSILITLDTMPPAAPTNVRTTAFHNCVDVEWFPSAAADVAGYIIERRTLSGNWAALNTNLALGTRYRDTTAGNGTTYLYRVIAVDDALDY